MNSQSEGLAGIDVDATADAEAKMQQLDAENLLESEKAPPGTRAKLYAQQNIRKEGRDNTEYEFVGGDRIAVEIKDSKIRSEEEKKVVQYERAEKQEAKEDRKEWLDFEIRKRRFVAQRRRWRLRTVECRTS